MRSIVFLGLAAILSAGCGAQTPRTVDCVNASSDKACSVRWVNGYKFTVIQDGDVMIVATEDYHLDAKTLYRTVGFKNLGSGVIDIDPEKLSSVFTDKTTSPAANAGRILSSKRGHASTMNILGTYLDVAIRGDQTAIVTQATGDNRVVSYFASAPALRQGDRQSAIDQTYKENLNEALFHNTLSGGAQQYGTVYFERSKGSKKDAHIESTSISLMGTIYTF